MKWLFVSVSVYSGIVFFVEFLVLLIIDIEFFIGVLGVELISIDDFIFFVVCNINKKKIYKLIIVIKWFFFCFFVVVF